jgi:hypothetical protein
MTPRRKRNKAAPPIPNIPDACTCKQYPHLATCSMSTARPKDIDHPSMRRAIEESRKILDALPPGARKELEEWVQRGLHDEDPLRRAFMREMAQHSSAAGFDLRGIPAVPFEPRTPAAREDPKFRQFMEKVINGPLGE